MNLVVDTDNYAEDNRKKHNVDKTSRKANGLHKQMLQIKINKFTQLKPIWTKVLIQKLT